MEMGIKLTARTVIRMIGRHKSDLTSQQAKTLKGQAISGNADAAAKGLYKILRSKSK